MATRLDEVSKELTKFPERPTHPTFEVYNEIQEVASTLASYVKGDNGSNALLKAVESIMTNFKKQLTDVKPSLDYKTPGYKAPVFSLDSDDDEPQTPTPARTQNLSIRSSTTPASSRKRPAEATPMANRRVKPDPEGSALEKQVYTLDRLRNEYEQGNTSGVPGSIDPKVTDRLIMQALEGWGAPVQRLIKQASDDVHNTVRDIVNKDLSTRDTTDLFKKTHETLDNFVAGLISEADSRITYLLACEQEKPVTFSKWTVAKKNCARNLEIARRAQRTTEYFDAREATARTPTTKEKRVEKSKNVEWCQTNLGDDDWANEIDCTATIFTYYDTASMCFTDTIAKHLEFTVLRPLRTGVAQVLLTKLEADKVDVCADLLAEHPGRERLRAELQAEQKKLKEAMKELMELQS